MRLHPLGAVAVPLGAVICGALIAAAWSLYRSPAMGLLLEAVRFCG